jgi:hypothetical protein
MNRVSYTQADETMFPDSDYESPDGKEMIDMRQIIEDAKRSIVETEWKDGSEKDGSFSDLSENLGNDLLKLGLTKKELDDKCEELFAFAPIEFRAKNGNKLEEKISNLIIEMNIKVPIIHIKDHSYLIGTNRCLCELRGKNVMIRVGGGYEKFSVYIIKN